MGKSVFIKDFPIGVFQLKNGIMRSIPLFLLICLLLPLFCGVSVSGATAIDQLPNYTTPVAVSFCTENQDSVHRN